MGLVSLKCVIATVFPVNVVTVLWTGWTSSYVGKDQWEYTKEHVKVLNSQIPELKVLSDCGIGYPLLEPETYRGWWAKIEVFRPEYKHLRPCLVIDLDTFILGDLAPILALDPTKLWLIEDFKGGCSTSSLFIAPKLSAVWATVQDKELPKKDGDFLDSLPHNRITDEVNGIVSYKMDLSPHTPPGRDVRIVCFHGNPKPPNVEGWAKDWWNKHR